MADKWNFNPLTEELEPADEETLAHAMPRTAFEASSSNRIVHMRPVKRETAFRGALPTIRNAAGFLNLCEMSLRAGVYVAIWRGSGGAVVLIDVFDGDRKVRYEATTQRELADAIFAACEELHKRYPSVLL